MRSGYADEYDCWPPDQLRTTLDRERIERQRRHASRPLPEGFDYGGVQQLRRKPGTGADCAVVDRRSVCRVRRIRFRHRFGSCTLIHAAGSFLAVKTDGEVVLFRDGGKGPEILARTRPLPGTLRALPALASGRLYLRDDRTLVALDVGPEPAARP